MGGEGAMMQAIHSTRNNSRRNQRDTFKTVESSKKSDGIKVEPISEAALEAIRIKIKQQKNVENIQMCSIIGIAIAIVGALYYGVSQLNGNDATHFFSMFGR